VWLDEETLDDDAVVLAERIIKAGTSQLPHDAYMAIWWACFLIDVKGSYQSGYAELQVRYLCRLGCACVCMAALPHDTSGWEDICCSCAPLDHYRPSHL
jgi:hypothetical protein